MGVPKWLSVLAHLAPQVLAFTPLAPIALPVAAAIAEAEAMKGATGPEKLAHVVNIATLAADAANAQAGREVIAPSTMQGAAQQAIATVVSVVNLVQQAKAAPPLADATGQP